MGASRGGRLPGPRPRPDRLRGGGPGGRRRARLPRRPAHGRRRSRPGSPGSRRWRAGCGRASPSAPARGLARLPRRGGRARAADQLAAAGVTVVCLPQGGCAGRATAGRRGTAPGTAAARGRRAGRGGQRRAARRWPTRWAAATRWRPPTCWPRRAGCAREDAYEAVSGAARAALGLPEVRVEAGFPAELLAVRGDAARGRAVARVQPDRGAPGAGGGADQRGAGVLRLGGRRSRWTCRGRARAAWRSPSPAATGRRLRRAAEPRSVRGRTVGGMRIVIAGGHGQIALRLERLLAARGRRGRGHHPQPGTGGRPAGGRRRTGRAATWSRPRSRRSPRICEGADAAVFAAGAGPGSGAARKETVDRGAAVLFADAAERAGVRRYSSSPRWAPTPEPPGRRRSSTSTCAPRAPPTTTYGPGPAWTGRFCGPAC